MPFTYEQIEELGHKVLLVYCQNKYELHELVNAVWLAGRATKAAKISHCIHFMRLDAIGYMRSCEGRTRRIRDSKGRITGERLQGIKRLQFWSMTALTEPRPAEGAHPNDSVAAYLDEPVEYCIAGELRECLLAGLNPVERLTLTMTFDGFNCREIGKASGYSESRISQIRTRVIEKCRAKMKRYDKEAEKTKDER